MTEVPPLRLICNSWMKCPDNSYCRHREVHEPSGRGIDCDGEVCGILVFKGTIGQENLQC